MKRFPCLVLDANIVIWLFAQGLWSAVVERCDLILSQTVIDEADYFQDSNGTERTIDLQPDITAGRLKVISVSSGDSDAFRARFDPVLARRNRDGAISFMRSW